MRQLHEQGKLTPAQQGCMETPRPTEFLYDVEADPHCIQNLADDPANGRTLRLMRATLSQWQERTGDRFPGEEKITPDGFDRTTGKRIISGAYPGLIKPR